MRRIWIVWCAAGCGGALQEACDHYTEAATACFEEALADDPVGLEEALAANVTEGCGIDGGTAPDARERNRAALECMAAEFETGDCSSPEALNASVVLAPCQYPDGAR